jgi:hypothetical protein
LERFTGLETAIGSYSRFVGASKKGAYLEYGFRSVLAKRLDCHNPRIRRDREAAIMRDMFVKPTLKYWVYGWVELAESIVRILSFGAIGTGWSMQYLCWCTEKECKKAMSVFEK